MSKLKPSTRLCALSIVLRHQPRLDGHVVVEAEPLHQPGHPVAGEALHQVVLEREVEARRARVALAAGAAAELVVDAPRLVALGADDVQAAGGDDPVVVLLGDRLGLGERRVVRRLVDLGRVEAALVERLRREPGGLPPSRMSVPRPAMLVAIVTAPVRPACATIAASFSWYLALRTSCLMPRRLSIVDSISDFSTDTVPTRTGRPASCISTISSISALNLAGSSR